MTEREAESAADQAPLHSTLLMYPFLLIIVYKLLIDVREVKTRFKLIKHIDTEKKSIAGSEKV
jgi:hypothetical protein